RNVVRPAASGPRATLYVYSYGGVGYALVSHLDPGVQQLDADPAGPRDYRWQSRARRLAGGNLQPLLPLSPGAHGARGLPRDSAAGGCFRRLAFAARECESRSEEHTSELQSRENLVCRLLGPPASPLVPYTTLFRSSWMQPPQGHEIIDGRAVPVDWLAVIFNPSFPYRLVHMVLAAFLATALLVAASGAWHLLRGNASPDRKSTRLNSSHVKISYAVFWVRLHLHSFPTRRSSDLAGCSPRRATRLSMAEPCP